MPRFPRLVRLRVVGAWWLVGAAVAALGSWGCGEGAPVGGATDELRAPANGVAPVAPIAPVAPVAPVAPPSVHAHRAIRERAARAFASAELLHPPSTDPHTGDAISPMAPLLLREFDPAAEPAAAATPPLRVGIAEWSEPWRDGTLARLAFAWDDGSGRAQGLRLTLGADGFPLLAEVLVDRSGATVLFAGRALEEQSAAEHGAPLPGRAFACECALDDAPAVVVAGLLERGPMPLGPFAYLEHGTGDVTLVLCRCSPAQVGQVPGSRPYALVPLAELARELPGAAAWLDPAAHPLESLLRWPSTTR